MYFTWKNRPHRNQNTCIRSPEQCIIIHHFWELCFLTPFRSLQNHRVVCKRYHHRVVDRKNCQPCPLISYAHCFVQGIKVASEISTSMWQKKKIVNRFEQFWVENQNRVRQKKRLKKIKLSYDVLCLFGPEFKDMLNSSFFPMDM